MGFFDMAEFERYEKVNKCETLNQLAEVIDSFADSNGKIVGRTKRFDAKIMSNICRRYTHVEHNMLTRQYGIRQQALYILFYTDVLE